MMHVHPLNDLQEHDLSGTCCECGPRLEIVNGEMLVIHNSFDGREFLEPQELEAM